MNYELALDIIFYFWIPAGLFLWMAVVCLGNRKSNGTQYIFAAISGWLLLVPLWFAYRQWAWRKKMVDHETIERRLDAL